MTYNICQSAPYLYVIIWPFTAFLLLVFGVRVRVLCYHNAAVAVSYKYDYDIYDGQCLSHTQRTHTHKLSLSIWLRELLVV